MPESARLELNFVAPPEPDDGVLGAFHVGLDEAPAAAEWPVQQVRTPVLGANGASAQEWWKWQGPEAALEPVQMRVLGAGEGLLRWRQADGLLFGVADMLPLQAGADARDLESVSEITYDAILDLLSHHSPSLHLWRVWNYIPCIHEEEAGLERYRCFNLGRARAMDRFGQLNERAIPAACALGVADGPLSVAFLAGAQRPVPLENPRQVKAYQYPPAYGPQPPSFARASLVADGEHLWLFVSGTASIVGHESRHLGNVSAQLHESMDNIEVLLAQAGRTVGHPAFTLKDLHHRVYVRSPSDAPKALEVLRTRLGGASWLMCQADVCRQELLVEIEAIGMLPTGIQR